MFKIFDPKGTLFSYNHIGECDLVPVRVIEEALRYGLAHYNDFLIISFVAKNEEIVDLDYKVVNGG